MKTARKLIHEAKTALGEAKQRKETLNWPAVAVLSGPDVVIEAVVAIAVKVSGIDMDWSYTGGRAFIQANGDRQAARRALYGAIPQSDLTEGDM